MSDDNPVLRELAERIASIERRIGALSVLEAKLTSASIIDATSAATANKIVLRDGSAGAAFAALTATDITASGVVSAVQGIKSRGSGGGTAAFSLDITDNPNTFTVANNATQDLFGSNAFGGALLIHDTATDGQGCGVVAMGNIVTLFGAAALYTNTLTTASKVNVAMSGGKLVLENKSGGSRTFAMMSLRTRTTQ